MSPPDILSAWLRAASFVLIFQAAGIAIFAAAFAAHLRASLPALRRVGQLAAGSAIVFVCCQFGLEAARMAGEFSGLWDRSLQALAVHSSAGASFLLRVGGLVLVALSLRRSSGNYRGLTLLGVLATALAFTLTGHTSVHAHRPLLALALLIHVLAGMFWFGALWPLWSVSVRESRATAGAIVAAFSTAAIRLVPLILVAGLVMTVLLVRGWHTFGHPYGQLLMAKTVLFAALMILAAANKRRFGPGIAHGSPGAAIAFRKVLAAEFALLCVVLAVTAQLTMFYSPE